MAVKALLPSLNCVLSSRQQELELKPKVNDIYIKCRKRVLFDVCDPGSQALVGLDEAIIVFFSRKCKYLLGKTTT